MILPALILPQPHAGKLVADLIASIPATRTTKYRGPVVVCSRGFDRGTGSAGDHQIYTADRCAVGLAELDAVADAESCQEAQTSASYRPLEAQNAKFVWIIRKPLVFREPVWVLLPPVSPLPLIAEIELENVLPQIDHALPPAEWRRWAYRSEQVDHVSPDGWRGD
jgi:hypothetical protein